MTNISGMGQPKGPINNLGVESTPAASKEEAGNTNPVLGKWKFKKLENPSSMSPTSTFKKPEAVPHRTFFPK